MTSAPPRRPGRRPGPKPRLSREMIIDATIAAGIEQVSMKSIAAILGTSTAGLYRYFTGRDELVVAALQTLLTTTPLPPPDHGWRAFLQAEAQIRWELLTRYYGLIQDNAASLTTTAAHRVERLVQGLVGCGFSVPGAVLAVDSVLDLVHDAAAQTARLYDPHEPGRLADEMPTMLAAYSDEVRTAVGEIIAAPRAHVDRKLAIVLDGIERQLAPASPS